MSTRSIRRLSAEIGVEQIGDLTAGESQKRGMLLLPRIGEAGIDEQLVGREGRVGRVVGDAVEIANEHDRQRRGRGGLDRFRRLRPLNCEWRRHVEMRRHHSECVAENGGVNRGPAALVNQRDADGGTPTWFTR
jgi:hypothetical protein